MSPRPLSTLAALLIGSALLLPGVARAQQTITVTGVGQATARPDTVVVEGQIAQSSEKMKDAVTAFRDTRRRSLAALDGLGVENLTVTTRSLSLSVAGDMGMMDNIGLPQAQPAEAGALTISQSITLTLTGLEAMEDDAVIDLVVKVIAAAREAGVDLSAMGQDAMLAARIGLGMPESSTALFKVSDPAQAERDALEAAMEKARQSAEHLAELAGGKLGPVVSIAELDSAVGGEPSNPYAMIFGLMSGDDDGPYASQSLEDITVVKMLSVSYQLVTE